MRQQLKWGIAFPALLMIAACASFPEKKTQDDSLVVIKVQITNPDHIPLARQYRLEFSPAYPPVLVSNTGSDVVFVVREPSVKISKITSKVSGSGFVGGESEEKVDIPLPYDPGHAVIADFAIIHRIEKGKGNGFVEYFYPVKLKDEDRADALSDLQKNPAFKQWDPE